MFLSSRDLGTSLRLANVVEVSCKTCSKEIYRAVNKFNENAKFGHNFYCSRECMAVGFRRGRDFLCGNPDCRKKFYKLAKEISEFNYCSRSCAAHVNNKKCPKGIARIWASRPAVQKVCRREECKKVFTGSGRYFCSAQCRFLAQYKHTKTGLLDIIRAQTRLLGRVPSKRECNDIVSGCVTVFGSWNNAVRAAGFEPYRSHDDRMYKRMRTKAKDGHLCDSVSEAIIDNWLTDHDIAHERDVHYASTNYKADWQLSNGTLVEYFGLAKDSPRYDRAVTMKRSIARQHNLSLVELYPSNLYPKLALDRAFRP